MKTVWLLFGLLLISNANNCQSLTPRCNSRLITVLRKYSTALVAGALIGSCTGTGCRYTRHYVHWIPAWIVWIIIRQELLELVQDELHACNLMDRTEIEECEDLMTSTAWISDWLNYLS